jgi:hypothetical protein
MLRASRTPSPTLNKVHTHGPCFLDRHIGCLHPGHASRIIRTHLSPGFFSIVTQSWTVGRVGAPPKSKRKRWNNGAQVPQSSLRTPISVLAALGSLLHVMMYNYCHPRLRCFPKGGISSWAPKDRRRNALQGYAATAFPFLPFESPKKSLMCHRRLSDGPRDELCIIDASKNASLGETCEEGKYITSVGRPAPRVTS